MRIIEPNHESLQYCGRIDHSDRKGPVFIYSASSVAFRFYGTKISVIITNHNACWSNYIGVIIDGIQTKICLNKDSKVHEYVIAENLAHTCHEVFLFKRQDSCHTFCLHGFGIDADALIDAPEAIPNRRIEVFGDSVSCGEVSEAKDYIGKEDPVHDGEYSNSWYSYAWITARKLHAQLHNTSQGGIALLDQTGWFAAPDYLGMKSCFDKMQYHPDLGEVKNWDFNRYRPHVVVVAIGQNDSHPSDYMAEDYRGAEAGRWRREYLGFVEQLMSIYPDSQIILQTTILNHHQNWDRSIEEVAQKLNDPRVHYLRYKRSGCGTPGHLRIREAEEMAEELTAYLDSLGEEIWQV